MHANRAGEFRLLKLLSESAQGTYQDWLAEHSQSSGVRRRLRLYLVAAGVSASLNAKVWCARPGGNWRWAKSSPAMKRSFASIASGTANWSRPWTTIMSRAKRGWISSSPARANFPSMAGSPSSGRWLTLRVAHDKRVFHGSIAPHSVLVLPPVEGGALRIKVLNWQTSLRAEHDTAGNTRLTGTVHQDLFWEDPSPCYTAPEVLNNPMLLGKTRRGRRTCSPWAH